MHGINGVMRNRKKAKIGCWASIMMAWIHIAGNKGRQRVGFAFTMAPVSCSFQGLKICISHRFAACGHPPEHNGPPKPGVHSQPYKGEKNVVNLHRVPVLSKS